MFDDWQIVLKTIQYTDGRVCFHVCLFVGGNSDLLQPTCRDVCAWITPIFSLCLYRIPSLLDFYIPWLSVCPPNIIFCDTEETQKGHSTYPKCQAILYHPNNTSSIQDIKDENS